MNATMINSNYYNFLELTGDYISYILGEKDIIMGTLKDNENRDDIIYLFREYIEGETDYMDHIYIPVESVLYISECSEMPIEDSEMTKEDIQEIKDRYNFTFEKSDKK